MGKSKENIWEEDEVKLTKRSIFKKKKMEGSLGLAIAACMVVCYLPNQK